jgi:predicted DNA-binding ribbon-helix-helix protein
MNVQVKLFSEHRESWNLEAQFWRRSLKTINYSDSLSIDEIYQDLFLTIGQFV